MGAYPQGFADGRGDSKRFFSAKGGKNYPPENERMTGWNIPTMNEDGCIDPIEIGGFSSVNSGVSVVYTDPFLGQDINKWPLLYIPLYTKHILAYAYPNMFRLD